MMIQFTNPSLLLMTSCETFITFLMYFTIENPDLQMLSEFHKIKKVAEEGTSEFTAKNSNIVTNNGDTFYIKYIC